MIKDYINSFITLFIVFLACDSYAQKYEDINSSNIEKLFGSTNNTSVGIQIGNSNYIQIFGQSQNLEITHLGSGNQTLFIDSSHQTSIDSKLNVNLIGNQNSIQIFGSNSISENMTLTQQSNNKIITVINR